MVCDIVWKNIFLDVLKKMVHLSTHVIMWCLDKFFQEGLVVLDLFGHLLPVKIHSNVQEESTPWT